MDMDALSHLTGEDLSSAAYSDLWVSVPAEADLPLVEPEPDVVPDGVREEERVLRHQREMRAHPVRGHRVGAHAVELGGVGFVAVGVGGVEHMLGVALLQRGQLLLDLRVPRLGLAPQLGAGKHEVAQRVRQGLVPHQVAARLGGRPAVGEEVAQQDPRARPGHPDQLRDEAVAVDIDRILQLDDHRRSLMAKAEKMRAERNRGKGAGVRTAIAAMMEYLNAVRSGGRRASPG